MNLFSLKILFFTAFLMTIPSFFNTHTDFNMNRDNEEALRLCWDELSLKASDNAACGLPGPDEIPIKYRQMYFLPVPINSAEYELLLTIPGVGTSTAHRIIEFRGKHGKIRSLEDLLLIEGIGDKKLSIIKEHAIVENE